MHQSLRLSLLAAIELKMIIIFPDTDFPPESHGEIDDVLQRISVGNGLGHWPNQPEEIEILQRLAGGRSGSEVLEVVIKQGSHEAHKVIKIGPIHELENEFHAYLKYLQNASALFVRIEAATPGVLKRTLAGDEGREAIVYDHAARFQGKPQSKTRTFEDLASDAVRHGGQILEQANDILEIFFRGVRNDLYEKSRVIKQETALHESWNLRLGIDAIVAVDNRVEGQQILKTTVPSPHGLKRATLWPRDIAKASVRASSDATQADLAQLNNATTRWWGNRLMAEVPAHHLRVEVVTDGDKSISQLASGVVDGSQWNIHGRLVSLRMPTHRGRLLDGLGDGFRLSEGVLFGKGARVRDPFAVLPDVLESRRGYRVTSLIHGDLNPRNILVTDDSPCLIDYAFTRDGEPIFMDFTRLEGSLTREVLPHDLTWKQHVRLQRLLAAACRLGDEAALSFAQQLEADRAELASAFRLLWAIRRAAREVYPQDNRDQWAVEYLEQLFLFAHLTLKWESKEDLAPNKLRATAAMAGVAAEALSSTDIYELCDEDVLRADGGRILQIIASQSELYLREMANLARALRRLNLKQNDPLRLEFEMARANFVKRHFRLPAHAAINGLAEDHDVYINLKAYIDLKGQLNAGRQRHQSSPEEMLESDELLAEGERLRANTGNHKDVLRLIAENSAVVVIGDAGSGKSTVAREWEYRLAHSIVDQSESVLDSRRNEHTNDTSLTERAIQPQPDETRDGIHFFIEPRMPINLRASALSDRLKTWKQDNLRSLVDVLAHDERDIDLLSIGALYIIVDALNELAEKQKQRVADWITALRKAFPDTPIMVSHRQYNYVPGLIPFPVITLQKVEIEQARGYIQSYLREKNVPDHERLAQRLIKLLLDDPDYTQIRDLAQTPLFLWMIVERYRITQELPKSRGGLFETFSNWYLEERYHEAHGELTGTRYSYEDKALLLGALGYEMVQRRETILPEKNVRRLIPQAIKNRWRKVLEEIITAEMLQRDGKNLRFLHQSFQEYFAARHFLATEGSDPIALRNKVWQLGWHDTFAVLLGFAGDETGIVTQVIEEALKVNPLLTARCLRMSEQPDAHLLQQFIAMQEAILRNASAGEFSHKRAAQALAEHGHKQAREALWRIAVSKEAPDMSRVAALNRLAGLPSQVRFELEADEIRQELTNHIPDIFDEPASISVQQAAINAIATTRLNDLGPYLAELVASGEWPLCRTAWKACDELGLKLTSRQQAVFITACRERLGKAEEELFQETLTARIDELNEERLDILRQLAAPSNLPLLLERRFSFAIQYEMEEILAQAARADEQPPTEAHQAWSILIEEPENEAVAIDRWLNLLRDPDHLTALAAAHRLMEIGDKLPGKGLIPLFDPVLSPHVLSAVAHLVEYCEDENLSQPLKVLIRSLMENIDSPESFEAFANLTMTLKNLDYRIGSMVTAVANAVFWTRRDEVIYHRRFPWQAVYSSNLMQTEDYVILLAMGGEDARAAVFELSIIGGGALQDADRVYSPDTLDNAALQQLQSLAESEHDQKWQIFFASASVQVHAVNLLPWLMKTACDLEKTGLQITIYSGLYEPITELYVCGVLRAIGYLLRILLDEKRVNEAGPAVAFLRERYVALAQSAERSIITGLAIGLGYIGDWQPILDNLRPEEPWMHAAARNVFEYWVPTPLSDASEVRQREEAAIWIARKLRDDSNLSPQVRSTLEHIKDRLEIKLGRHIQTDDA